MPLTINHVWTCDICGQTVRSDADRYELGDTVLHPWVPIKWNWINHSLVCDRHELTIDKEKGPERKGS